MGELWRRLAEGKFEPRPATWKDWLGLLLIPVVLAIAYFDSWPMGCGGDERRHAALFNRYDEVRAKAAFGYGKYPPADDAEVRSLAPRLLELVHDPVAEMRRYACFTLGRLGRRVDGGVDRTEVVAALIGALNDRTAWVREAALDALAGACEGMPCREAIAPLIGGTRSADRTSRFYAIAGLGSVATADDAGAIAALDLRAARGDEREREAARRAISAIRARHSP